MPELVLAAPRNANATETYTVPRAFFEAHPILTFEFTAAGQQLAVSHGLGRVPVGYIVVGRSAQVTVYDGFDLSTADVLVLRASGSAVVKVVAL